MQGLIAVGLWNGNPITQSIGVGRVEICDHTVSAPRIAFLLLRLGVEHNADGENVVDVLKGDLLLLHLVPDAGNGFGPAFDGKFETFLGECFFDGRSKGVDEARAHSLGFAQLLLNHSVFLRLTVAQT